MKIVKKKKSDESSNSWIMGIDRNSARRYMEEAQNQQKKQFVPFVWIPDGESRELIFVDRAPFTYESHTVRIGGKFRSYTCPQVSCALCESGQRKTRRAAFRVVNLTPWKDKKGEEHANTPQVLSLAGTYYLLLEDEAKESGVDSFENVKFKLRRRGNGIHTTYTPKFLGSGNLSKSEQRAVERCKSELSLRELLAPPSRAVAENMASLHRDEDTDDIGTEI